MNTKLILKNKLIFSAEFLNARYKALQQNNIIEADERFRNDLLGGTFNYTCSLIHSIQTEVFR